MVKVDLKKVGEFLWRFCGAILFGLMSIAALISGIPGAAVLWAGIGLVFLGFSI